MNCERCEQGPAEIDYTEVREGHKTRLKICRKCARSLGFDEEDLDPASGEDAPERGEGRPPPAAPPPGEAAQVVKPGEGFFDPFAGLPGADPDEDEGEEEEGEESDLLARRRCPGCGLSGARLRDQSLFGCPTCYEVFREALDPLFKRIHGASLHRGRLPGGRCVQPGDPDELARSLQEALEREDYEEAAKLRDRLRRAGGTPPPTEGEGS